MRLTLRTLLAYLDDTLPPAEATKIGQKVAESEQTRDLIEKIKRLTRKRGLVPPSNQIDDPASNPNTVAEYLSDNLSSEMVTEFESACLDSEINLAEVAACHQILTLLLSEPARVPPTARKRMYELVKGPESLPNRKPGLTIPVGGMPIEKPSVSTVEENPGLLHGLSPASFGIRTVLAMLMLGVTLIATWLAWPNNFQQAKPRNVEVAAADTNANANANVNETKPTPNAEKDSVKDNNKEGNPNTKTDSTSKETSKEPTKEPSKGTPGTAVDSLPEGNPEKTPGKTPEKSPEKKPDENRVEKQPAEPLPIDRDRIDSTTKTIGTLTSKDQILLSSSAETWTRLADATPIRSSERLLCLPGYKAKILLESKVNITLWGNVPDQIPTGPLESSITLHVPSAKRAADLTVHNGRVYLQSTDPKGATIRVRMADAIADIRLPDDQAEVAVDVKFIPTKGLRPSVVVSKRTEWSLAATRGSVRVEGNATMRAVQLATNEGIDSMGRSAETVGKRLERQLVYPDAVMASNAQKSLATLSAAFSTSDRVTVKLAESVNSESPARARIAIFGQAAIGEVTDLADELQDAGRPLVRDAAVVALRSALAVDPDRGERIANALKAKLTITAAQSQWILALLRGPDELDLKSRETLNRIVDGLTADNLPERELCHRTLILDYDPEALRIPGLVRYDPAGPVEDRDACQKLWRKRIEERSK
ncbi:MAG: hypothetical protein U0798_12230 [Gemmataceae bacterium]